MRGQERRQRLQMQTSGPREQGIPNLDGHDKVGEGVGLDSQTEPPVQLVANTFGAAGEEQRWPNVVRDVTTWLGGLAGALQVRVLLPRVTMEVLTCGVDEGFGRAYNQHFFLEDPHLVHVERLRQGEAVVSRDLITDRDLEGTAFFQDWARPQGLQDLVGCTIIREPTRVVTYATYGPRRFRFDERSKEKLQALLPHLQRAVRLWLELRTLRAMRQPLDSDVGVSTFASVRVDRRLKVLSVADSSACTLTDALFPLRLQAGRLDVRPPLTEDAVKHAVTHALAGASFSMRVATASHRVELLAAPSSTAPGIAVDLMVWASRQTATTKPLPPSLARIADLLARGLSDKEIAIETGMPYVTVRTYVARTMAKLGVQSRRHLMR